MNYYDRYNKKIRQGDILWYEFGNGSKNVLPVSKQNGELGIADGREFIPLSETRLECARLQRPRKSK